MRIAIFSDVWLPRIDGVTTSVQGLVRVLEARGHTTHIFCPSAEAASDDKVTRYKGVPFWGYPDFHLAFREGEHDTEALLREGRFDLVHVQSPFLVGLLGLRAARAVGLPVVTSYHTYLPDLVPYVFPRGSRAAARRLVWRLTGAFFRRCDTVLAPSPSCAAELVRHVPGHKIRNLQVHPNGVDLARFHPGARTAEMRARLSPDGSPVLVSIGRLAREKDLPFLVAAFARARQLLPGLHLAIGGSGPDRERVEDAVVAHGLQDAVRFLGFVPDGELAATYASADAFATASRFETQGMTALEAAACGLPVAAVRERGLADYVRHRETGFLFEPGDVEGAAQAIVRAVTAGRGMRAEARRHAEQYSLEHATDLIEAIYGEVLEAHRRKGASRPARATAAADGSGSGPAGPGRGREDLPGSAPSPLEPLENR